MANFTIYKGDYWELPLTFRYKDTKKPINLTDDKIYFTLKTDKSVADGSATHQLIITCNSDTNTDVQEGTSLAYMTSTTTNAFSPATYYYDIKWIRNDGTNKPRVLFEGYIEIKDTVTDAVS